MLTYSINIGTNTESNSIDISDISQFESLLSRLSDNLEGLINPDDLRDTILSSWSNISFKETTASNSDKSYIGIDSGNPSDRDVKLKVLLGKKLNSSNDVLSNQLLSEDTDIYFYNTKSDNISNTFTKISFISGDNPNLFLNSPFIQSKVVSGLPDSFLSMDIINNLGNIDIESSQDFVNINGINFPDRPDNIIQSPINNKVLRYVNSGNLDWYSISADFDSNLGTTGSNIIFSGNLNFNEYSLEFTDSRLVPTQIGDIKIGESFSKYSLSDILKRIIYSYQAPTAFLSILPPFQNGYVEFGSSPNIFIEFTINKKSLPTLITTLNNMTPGNYPAIISEKYQTVVGVASAFILKPIAQFSANQSVNIKVSDGIESNSFSKSILGVYPYFHGISIQSINISSVVTSLTKLLDGKFTRTLKFIGNGFIYYSYPISYGPLSDIINSDNTSIFNTFTTSNVILSSSSGFWYTVGYLVYRSNDPYNLSIPTDFTFVI
jgi:hypothetical protein